MNGNLAGRYALGSNIDATATSGWNAGAGFARMGNLSTNQFTVSFGGLGHTITSVVINLPTTYYVGLFGYVATGSIVRKCGATLAAGANCPISVTFTPTAAGTRTGGVTITSDVASSPNTVSLSGTGVASAYTVTPTAGSGGSISPNTPQVVTYGSTASFTVTPNSGYQIASVTGCGGMLSDNTYITNSISANCTVTAAFSVIDVTAPTTTASPAGGTYTSAQSVTLTCSDGTGSGCGNIYYTTNGTTPDIFSTVYTGPINITLLL